MVSKLDDVQNVGGSIKIGATGKISVLISKELQSTIEYETTEPRKRAILQPNDTVFGLKLKEKAQTKNIKHNHARKASRNPILNADNNISKDGSPNRNKKRSYVVEVVDVKCGIPDKIWAANPIKDRLKKLTLSKLSGTNMA